MTIPEKRSVIKPIASLDKVWNPHAQYDNDDRKKITFSIVSHMSFAVKELSSDNPKHGKTVTLTFWVSEAAIANVTGGFPLPVLQNHHTFKTNLSA